MEPLIDTPTYVARNNAEGDRVREHCTALNTKVDELLRRVEALEIPEYRKVVGRRNAAEAKKASNLSDKRARLESLRIWLTDREGAIEDERIRARLDALGIDARGEFARFEAERLAQLDAVERIHATAPEARRARATAWLDEHEHKTSSAPQSAAPSRSAGPAYEHVQPAAAVDEPDAIPPDAREAITRELESAGLPVDDATVRAIWEEQR